MTMARTLFRTAAGLFALSIGSAGNLLAAASPAPVASEERPAAERIVDKVGEKIGEKIDEKLGQQTVEKIDEAHEEQARFFGEFFEKVDRVFGEQYVEDRERKLQVRAGVETTFNADGDSTDTALKIGLRVPLPAMKRRFNLFIDIGEDVNELGAVSSPSFSASEKNYSLAAGLIHRYRDNLEAGIKLRLFRSSGALASLYPFVRFEQKDGSMRYFFEQRITGESDNSWSSQTYLDVDRRFRSGLFLRLSNSVDYSFGEPGASIAHGLITRRSVYQSNGFSLELWLAYNTAKDNPVPLEDDTIVYAQLRLRGRIWRNWLLYELRPIYTIPIDTERNSFFGFFVSLTVIWDSYLGGDDTLANLDR